MRRLHDERAPGAQLGGTPQTRENHHPPEQMIGSHSKSTDRAMLRLMGVLRRIAESNVSEETEIAA